LKLPHQRAIAFFVTAGVTLLMPVLTGMWRNFDPTRGPAALAPLVVPLALAVFPLATPKLKIPCGLLLLLYSLIVLSVGILYLPCAVLILWPEKDKSSTPGD